MISSSSTGSPHARTATSDNLDLKSSFAPSLRRIRVIRCRSRSDRFRLLPRIVRRVFVCRRNHNRNVPFLNILALIQAYVQRAQHANPRKWTRGARARRCFPALHLYATIVTVRLFCTLQMLQLSHTNVPYKCRAQMLHM